MAEKKFFVDINLQGSALTNATIGTNSSLTKAGSFGFDGTRLKYFNGTAIEEVANLADIAAVTGGLIFQGGYDPNNNAPDITDGSAFKGFFWVVTIAGSFLDVSVQVGDSIVAKVDAAGATAADWLILQGNIVIATDSVDGISRLATQTEANDGTASGAVVITPATLQGKIDAQITPEISSKLPLAGGDMSGNINMGGNQIENIDVVKTAVIQSRFTDADVFLNDNLDAQNTNTIKNLPAPTNSGDAANKTYVDDNTSNKLPLAGGTMTGNIDMGAHVIQFDGQQGLIMGLAAPAFDQDAARKIYVDTTASTAQANAEATASADATAKADAAQAAAEAYADSLAPNYDAAGSAAQALIDANAYTDTGLADKLDLAGGTMSGSIYLEGAGSIEGAINLSGQYLVVNEIQGLNDSEIVVDAIFNMAGRSIIDLAAPTNDTDAANKLYVDTAITASSYVETIASADWYAESNGTYSVSVTHNLNAVGPNVTFYLQSVTGEYKIVEFEVLSFLPDLIQIASNVLPSTDVRVRVSK